VLLRNEYIQPKLRALHTFSKQGDCVLNVVAKELRQKDTKAELFGLGNLKEYFMEAERI
jgi:hypothetical protein